MIDYEAIFGGVDYDPCAALAALRPAYIRLIAGEGEQKIEFRDRQVWFQAADTKPLKSLIAQLESECAAKQGVTRVRRMAITAGAPRTRQL